MATVSKMILVQEIEAYTQRVVACKNELDELTTQLKNRLSTLAESERIEDMKKYYIAKRKKTEWEPV